jgi:hypothetical protein
MYQVEAIPQKLADKLQAAQADTTAVGKESRNEFQRYSYTSAEEVLEHVQPILARHGLGVFRISWHQEMTYCDEGELDVYKTKLHIFFQLHAHEIADAWITNVEWPVVVTKGRPEDKTIASGLTDATKYWLLGMLLIPRCDEEMDQRNDSVESVPPSKGRQSNDAGKI